MPRKTEWPPRIYLHKPSGQSRIRVGGRDYYLGPHGSPEAQREYVRVVAELVESGQAGPTRTTTTEDACCFKVADVVARWLRDEGPAVCTERGRELAQFRQSFAPLLRLYGSLPAAAFDAATLNALRQAMATGSWMTEEDRKASNMRRDRVGWARQCVNQRVGRIKRLWCWAEQAKLVPAGSYAALAVVRPLRKGTALAREGKARCETTLSEVCLVGRDLARRRCAVVRAMLLFQWWTGARSAEVRIMRVSDVSTSGPIWVYRPSKHKTDYLGHPREVAIGRRARAVLRPWLEKARENGPDAPVFPPSRRRRGPDATYTTESYAKAVRQSADACGLRDFQPYGGRHAAARRIREQAGDEAARTVLGQKSLAVNLRYAATPDAALARRTQEKLG